MFIVWRTGFSVIYETFFIKICLYLNKVNIRK